MVFLLLGMVFIKVNHEKLCNFSMLFFVVLCKLKFHLGVPVFSVKMNDPGKMCLYNLHKMLYMVDKE